MKLTSPAFDMNQAIPSKYTCQGENISPPLEVGDVPHETQSLAVILDDPDAPSGDFVHWVVWDIDPGTTGIDENRVPTGAIQGINSASQAHYTGPCPPSGTHHYHFKLYALDTKLTLPSSAQKQDLLQAMEGHNIVQAELVGTYQKS